MRSYFHIVIFLTTLAVISCDFKSNSSFGGKTYKIEKVEGSKNLYLETADFSGVVFATDKTFGGIEDSSRFTPTIAEIFKAENIFEKCLLNHKKDTYGIEADPKRIQKTINYYRQYIGYKNEKGQKVIYFNCFTKGRVTINDKWKEREVIVRDGGNEYFSIVINLELQDCSMFMVHGKA